jgi:hypothetical protein
VRPAPSSSASTGSYAKPWTTYADWLWTCDLPPSTRNHDSNILTKLQATDRHDAARIARDAGLTPESGLT